MKPDSNARGEPRWPIAVFALVLAIAMAIVVGTRTSATVDPTSDDGYYLSYMKSVSEQGLGVFPKLFDTWNSDKEAWIYPPPSRIGFVVISALWASIAGASLDSLQYLSIVAYAAGALVTYFFARRQFGEPKALFIGALWLFSPLLMGIARMALTDSVIALCMSLSTWLFLELVQEPKSLRRKVLFMLAFGCTVLVKELSVLLLIPFSAFVLIEKFWRREPLNLATFALVFALPGVVVLPLFVLAAGSFSNLIETTHIVLASPATNEYAIRYGSGPWFRYVVDFVLLSPCTTLLAAAYLGVLARELRDGVYDRRLVFLALIAGCLIFEYSFFTKNLRYAVLCELSIRVFAVWMVMEICRSANAARSMMLSGIAVAALCWLDWRAFDLYGVRYKSLDPITMVLAGIHHLIPYPVR